MLKTKFILLSISFFSVATVVFIACKKNQAMNVELQIPSKFSPGEKKMLADFLHSSEYSRVVESIFKDFGQIDLSKSVVDYVDNDRHKPIFNLVFTSANKVNAFLVAIPIKKTIDNVLPNNEHYAMMLVDYKNYNTDIKTGDISFVDLNYDNFIAASLKVNKSNIEISKGYKMAADIAMKYSGLKKKTDLNNPTISTDINTRHYCDRNGNGNVGFGECMSCMSSACYGSPTCATFCAVINIAE